MAVHESNCKLFETNYLEFEGLMNKLGDYVPNPLLSMWGHFGELGMLICSEKTVYVVAHHLSIKQDPAFQFTHKIPCRA